jgi:hypothetical protein
LADPASAFSFLHQARSPLPNGNLTYYVMGLLIVCGCALAAVAWELLPRREGFALRAPALMTKGAESAAATALAAKCRAAETAVGSWQLGNEQKWQHDVAPTSLARAAQRWVATRVQVLDQAARGVMRAILNMPIDPGKSTAVVKDIASATTESIHFAVAVASSDASLVLALPRFVDHLQVTDQQQREINAIVKAARDATREVQRHSREIGTVETMHQIERIRSSASQQVLAILSPAQAQELRGLMSGKRGATASQSLGEKTKE